MKLIIHRQIIVEAMESCDASQVVETWQGGVLPPATHAIKEKEDRQDGEWFGLGSI
jgi:hypothetical protein